MSNDTLYQLSNLFYGYQLALQVDQESADMTLKMGPIGPDTLNWTITPDAEVATDYRLCTTSNSIQQCLDESTNSSENHTLAYLANPSDTSSQLWNLKLEKPGVYYITNSFLGDGWKLDTFSGSTTAFMSDGNYQGQFWALHLVQGKSAFSIYGPNVLTQDTSSSTSQHNSGISTGATVGIILSVVLSLFLAIAALVVMTRRRRKANMHGTELSEKKRRKKPDLPADHLYEASDGQVYELEVGKCGGND